TSPVLERFVARLDKVVGPNPRRCGLPNVNKNFLDHSRNASDADRDGSAPRGPIVRIECARLTKEVGVTAAIDVVRQGLAATEAGDMETASATFAPLLVYRLHGGHPLAGTFDGKQAALGAM